MPAVQALHETALPFPGEGSFRNLRQRKRASRRLGGGAACALLNALPVNPYGFGAEGFTSRNGPWSSAKLLVFMAWMPALCSPLKGVTVAGHPAA